MQHSLRTQGVSLIRQLPRPVIVCTLTVRSATVKPPGAAVRASTAVRVARIRGLFHIDPADAGGADLGGQRQLIEGVIW